MSSPLAMTGVVQVGNPTTPRWLPPEPPLLSKEGSHFLTTFT